METSPAPSPDMPEFERLIDQNCNERKQLLEREWQLRDELQTIVRQKMSSEKFAEVRARERETRAELSRNLDQYDVLMEKWAAEATKE
jgi:hypothetical protein